MKVGIMQPYFIPYIGYWQLLNAVDKYVVYDDVNFIKGGWINRNRILLNDTPYFFNIPMQGASSNKLINDIGVDDNLNIIRKKLRIIENAYVRAPYYKEVYPIIENVMKCGKTNLAEFILYSQNEICKYLQIETEVVVSSGIEKNNDLKSQNKVIHICKLLQADEYINAIGGKNLYSREEFDRNGIALKFLKTNDITYKQFDNEFVSNLSILDVMMFNSVEDIKGMLNNYSLV